MGPSCDGFLAAGRWRDGVFPRYKTTVTGPAGLCFSVAKILIYLGPNSVRNWTPISAIYLNPISDRNWNPILAENVTQILAEIGSKFRQKMGLKFWQKLGSNFWQKLGPKFCET